MSELNRMVAKIEQAAEDLQQLLAMPSEYLHAVFQPDGGVLCACCHNVIAAEHRGRPGGARYVSEELQTVPQGREVALVACDDCGRSCAGGGAVALAGLQIPGGSLQQTGGMCSAYVVSLSGGATVVITEEGPSEYLATLQFPSAWEAPSGWADIPDPVAELLGDDLNGNVIIHADATLHGREAVRLQCAAWAKVAKLAAGYSFQLRETLTDAQWREMVAKNERMIAAGRDCCASHDYCDANMVCDTAWSWAFPDDDWQELQDEDDEVPSYVIERMGDAMGFVRAYWVHVARAEREAEDRAAQAAHDALHGQDGR